MNDLHSAIRNRRSIRKYTNQPVEKEKLATILDAARWAPSWTNSQCWHFVVIEEPELKILAADYMHQNRAAQAVREAPILIVICAEIGKSGYYKGQKVTDKDSWPIFDTALCTQNLALQAYALGLGTVIIGYFDAKAVAGLIKLPNGYMVVAMTPIGYPNEFPSTPPRKSLQEITHSNRFGDTLSL